MRETTERHIIAHKRCIGRLYCNVIYFVISIVMDRSPRSFDRNLIYEAGKNPSHATHALFSNMDAPCRLTKSDCEQSDHGRMAAAAWPRLVHAWRTPTASSAYARPSQVLRRLC